jgi:2-polyprenyl-3-methyl-5-hydroxy-6-metoxy-1,4-benzoquinol methylase
MLSLARRSYQAIPFPLRAAIWRVRDVPRRVLRRAANALSFWLSARCNACGGKNFGKFTNDQVRRVPFTFYKCRDCSFIFVLPPVSLPPAVIYEQRTMPEFGTGEGIWNAHYLECINRYVKGGKLLEVGFGNASFLKLAHESGWEVAGVELSVPEVNYARQELKLPNITLGLMEEVSYPAGSFDVVAAFNFIEHVPDPRATLREMWRILRPGGCVALMVPNISGIFHSLMPELLGDNDPLVISWVPPDHLSYFSKSNFRILLESVGFTDVMDESHRMPCLWRQFEVQIGPEPGDKKLAQLMADLKASSTPRGDALVAEFRGRIKSLLAERMTWTMLKDLMELEPLLSSEVGILFLAKKPSN